VSLSVPHPIPPNRDPDELPIVAPPKTIGEAVHQMHGAMSHMDRCVTRLEKLWKLDQTSPEMRTITINAGNNGQYVTTHRQSFACKSIGFLNPGAANVFVGIGGVSARPTSGAPVVPGGGALVLPVEVGNYLELGCDPAVLLAATAVVYVFLYVTVQPLLIIGNV
jgi:hypothetical protein